MVITFLQVALGGAIGACLRMATGMWVARLAAPAFPLAVLSVNILGSFLMGGFAVWMLERGHGALSAFMMTGLLGGFTTFSAFSLEVMTLVEQGDILLALLYVGLSVGLSVGALGVGLWLMRGVLV